MSNLRSGDVVDGRYEVQALLGRGGMGAVYRALDRTRGVEVALKVVRVELAEAVDVMRFVREAELAARVDRLDGVVRVHAAGVHGGAPFYVMELASGRDLRTILREEGPLEPRRLVAIVEALARTLGACHAAGVVHRDVKPGNVIVGEDGRPRLFDFGLARDVRRETRMTATGEVLGTPAYMAPEQVRGDAVDGRADVYALGGLLHAGLTGEPPFQGAVLAVLDAKLTADPPRPSARRPDVPPALDAICVRAMAREPDARYPSAEALADDLARWARGESIDAQPRRGRRRLVAVGALLTVSAVVLGVVVGRGVDARAAASARAELEAALEWDGARCVAEPARCRAGEHALVAHALGLGVGPAPTLDDLRARRARLDAGLSELTPGERAQAVATRERLAAWTRLLDGSAAGEPGGDTGALVDALRAAEAGDVAGAAARVLALARAPRPAPPELAPVVERLALEALRTATWNRDLRDLLTQVAPRQGPRVAELRREVLRGADPRAAWADRLRAALGEDDRGVDEVLGALEALLVRGRTSAEPAPADVALEVPFLQAVLEALRDAAVERLARIDARLARFTGYALPPADFIRAKLLAAFPHADGDLKASARRVPPGARSDLLLAALRHDVDVMIEPGHLEDLETLVGPDSQALAFARFVRWLREDERRAFDAAVDVVQAPAPDLAPRLRAFAHEEVVRVAVEQAQYAGAAGWIGDRDRFARLAVDTATRYRAGLGRDLVPTGPEAPARIAHHELVARAMLEGWPSAAAAAEVIARESVAMGRGRAGADEGATWLHVWLIETLTDPPLELAADDASSRAARVGTAARLARLTLEREDPPEPVAAMYVRAVAAKALRVFGDLDAAERALAPYLEAPDWPPHYAAEAARVADVRGLVDVFRARARKAIELWPDVDKVVEMAVKAGVLPPR